MQEVWGMHLLRAVCWVKGSWLACPYDMSKFLSNFYNIRIRRSIVGPRLASWEPPELGIVKFNVDESSLGNSGPCGVVGVLILNLNQEILGVLLKNAGTGWAFKLKLRPF